MTEFFEKNKKYIVPAILFLVYALFTIFTWGRWGHAIADCFREAVIPQAILDGKVLYSDITCIYPPLAYQFNAVMFKIFGNSLNVLYFWGIICSLTVLTLLYKIAEKKCALLTTFVLILFKSTPKFSSTRAATPSPSLIKPKSKCSVPI